MIPEYSLTLGDQVAIDAIYKTEIFLREDITYVYCRLDGHKERIYTALRLAAALALPPSLIADEMYEIFKEW